MSQRDLLMEFVQWLAENPTFREDLFEAIQEYDPLTTDVVIDEFLEALGSLP